MRNDPNSDSSASPGPPTLFGPDGPRLGPDHFRRGERIVWTHRSLGRCLGVVVGVYPRGLVARREGVERGRPHCLPFDAASHWPF